MRAACIQLCSGTEISDNIDAAERLIRKAAAGGAELITTPEMTHILQRSPSRLFEAARTEDKDMGVRRFSQLARELSVHLLIGSLAIKIADDRMANRSFLFGPDGGLIAKYDKIHLFDVTLSRRETWKESAVYQAGNRAVVASAGPIKLGLSICYDLRFADLYRTYAQAGAQALCIPSAFTKPTGEAHWESLLRARAIETGSYVLAPAQGGVHADGRQTWGHSMIIDPWGVIVRALDNDKPGIITAQLDSEAVYEARRRIPAWSIDPPYTLDVRAEGSGAP